ncbi:phosphatase [Bacillus sp. P14.5]|uniref:phosphatase n=1 Tax=Bacillus sp. P14.5 TaxID=1983400 RepID=UPI000DEB17DA|nr:phosphatase [Bacillus sp. P14.5]
MKLHGGIYIKNLQIGLILIISSAITYGGALIAASVYSLVLAGDGGQGWDGRYGIFGTALKEAGTLPVTISILSFLIGLGLIGYSLVRGDYSKE